MNCTALNDTRKHIAILQKPHMEDNSYTIAEFLLFINQTEENITKHRDDLQLLWQKRHKILLAIEE